MKTKQLFEKLIHGAFFILGMITVVCVGLITIYLLISGIPAISKIGFVDFIFGKEWASTASTPKIWYFAFYSY